jgi:hypothetical protein
MVGISACAYAFLGGIERSVSTGRLGFHQFYRDGASYPGVSPGISAALGMSQAQLVMGILTSYVVEMGVDARILTLATTSEPDQMTFPSIDQLVRFNVVTRKGFSAWQIKPVNSGLVAFVDQEDAAQPARSISLFCRADTGSAYVLIVLERVDIHFVQMKALTMESMDMKALGVCS